MWRICHRKIRVKERIKKWHDSGIPCFYGGCSAFFLAFRRLWTDNGRIMKIIDKTFQLDYREAPEDALFLDIETTGLKAETSHLYLFGCIRQESPGSWHFRQWLAESPFEERAVLREVNRFCEGFSAFVHFNGNRFDLPYLDAKAEGFGLDSVFMRKKSIDLYPVLKPLRALLHLPNCRQKSFESFLFTGRQDIYNGGELISFYYRYVRSGEESLLKALLLHNEEDVLGTVSLLALLPYVRLLAGETVFSGIRTLSQDDVQTVLRLDTPDVYPVPVTARDRGILVKAQENRVLLQLPTREQTLKFFYPDFKDYFYLISEDQAIHRSVAAFVNPSNLKKATKETCYIKKTARFYPLMRTEGTDIFRDSAAGTPYGLWDEALAADPAGWSAYIGSFLRGIKN